MVYKYESCEPIIADFLSKTRFTDANYADDMLLWIKQGINMMRLRNMLVPEAKVIEVRNQVGRFPCTIVMLDGLYYKGQRLRKGTGVIDNRICKDKIKPSDYQSYFQHDTTANQQDYALIRGLDLKAADMSENTTDYYIPFPNHIQTTFQEGEVICFYRKLACDERGYPLIPDEENIRYALFWWLMAQVTLSGFKHADPRMDYEYCEAKFNQYKKEGKRAIKYWSVDTRQSITELTINLIPPHGYYERFFINGEQPKFVEK